MRHFTAFTLLAGAAVLIAGCSARPISRTLNAAERVYNTTGQVYRASRSVADLMNPMEYLYFSMDVSDAELASVKRQPRVKGGLDIKPAAR